MNSELDTRALACCAAIHDELQRLLPEEGTIFLGPVLADGGDPAVAELHARGAHFFWVALPIGGASFWDAHVGIVVDPATLTGSAGVHYRRGLAGARAPTLSWPPLEHAISEATDEEQWNAAPRDLSTASAIAAACEELVVLLRAARREAGAPPA